jgi:hypothetical protein
MDRCQFLPEPLNQIAGGHEDNNQHFLLKTTNGVSKDEHMKVNN